MGTPIAPEVWPAAEYEGPPPAAPKFSPSPHFSPPPHSPHSAPCLPLCLRLPLQQGHRQPPGPHLPPPAPSCPLLRSPTPTPPCGSHSPMWLHLFLSPFPQPSQPEGGGTNFYLVFPAQSSSLPMTPRPPQPALALEGHLLLSLCPRASVCDHCSAVRLPSYREGGSPGPELLLAEASRPSHVTAGGGHPPSPYGDLGAWP